MKHVSRFTVALAVMLLLPVAATLRVARAAPTDVIPQIAPATQPAKTSDFLRFVDQGASGGRLETADVVFVNNDGAVVRLVSAVHIGEKAYYKSLNDTFKQRDAVLYELIKPKDGDLPGNGVRSGSGVSEFQRMLKDTLNLSFQLDEVDYHAANFIHADLDAETFAKKQEERGESMMTLMLNAMMKAMTNPPPQAQQAQNMDAALEDLVKILCRPDGERQLKLFFARNMTQFENDALGLDGPNGSVILTERNKAAVEALQSALRDGKRDIAIFYGAAHMPDLSKRLASMGFKPIATEWRLAWDLALRADEPSMIEKVLMDAIRGMDD
jgi:hypothetical protein